MQGPYRQKNALEIAIDLATIHKSRNDQLDSPLTQTSGGTTVVFTLYSQGSKNGLERMLAWIPFQDLWLTFDLMMCDLLSVCWDQIMRKMATMESVYSKTRGPVANIHSDLASHIS